MSLTALIGSEESRLSNVVPGLYPLRVVPGRIGTIITLFGHYQPNLPLRRKVRS